MKNTYHATVYVEVTITADQLPTHAETVKLIRESMKGVKPEDIKVIPATREEFEAFSIRVGQ
jgi:hypothetical protein